MPSCPKTILKNPLSLFDVKGKTAIVTGATGAFGALAAKVLSGAGCNVVLSAGGAEALKKVAKECENLGAKTETVNVRPSSAANCDKIVEAAVKRFGGIDIVVLAVRHQQSAENRRSAAGRFR